MVYTARTVVLGKTGEDPFLGFILASKSLKNRRLEVRQCGESQKIYVFPATGYESDNINYPEVDNYSCIISQKIMEDENFQSSKKRLLVGFNGHMAKRCSQNILDGMKPFLALDSTLFEFRGARKDARVGAVIYEDPSKGTSAFYGINDLDRVEKKIKKIDLESNKAIYLSVADTSKENFVAVPPNITSVQLAEFMAREMIPGLENLVGTGVCILRKDNSELGVYNTFK